MKLRFSLSKDRLDKTLITLRTLNGDFRVICDQILQVSSIQHQDKRAATPDCKKEVDQYAVLGLASRQIYEALGEACTQHAVHQGYFCVEAEQTLSQEGTYTRTNFTTFIRSADSYNRESLPWLVVQSINRAPALNRRTDCSSNLAQGIKWGKGESQVFQRYSKAPAYTLPSSVATGGHPLSLNKGLPKNSINSMSARQIMSESKCLTDLRTTDTWEHFIQTIPDLGHQGHHKAVSLAEIIVDYKKHPMPGRLPPVERLRLAISLAIAVLQYHPTPWLATFWRSDDVFFFGLSDDSTFHAPSGLPPPHLEVLREAVQESFSRFHLLRANVVP